MTIPIPTSGVTHGGHAVQEVSSSTTVPSSEGEAATEFPEDINNLIKSSNGAVGISTQEAKLVKLAQVLASISQTHHTLMELSRERPLSETG